MPLRRNNRVYFGKSANGREYRRVSSWNVEFWFRAYADRFTKGWLAQSKSGCHGKWRRSIIRRSIDFPFTDAIADQNFVFYSQTGDLATVYSPRRRSNLLLVKYPRAKCRVCLWPERSGLENSDIIKANAIVSVPVNEQFPSLNLAQCILLLAYEWMLNTSKR